MGHHACSVFVTPGVMVFRLNKSLKYGNLIPTPHCSGPAPTFVPFYSEYSTPPVSSTMPEKTNSVDLNFHSKRGSPQTAGDLTISNYTVLNPFKLQRI
jgi:hypothetical protein